MRSIKAGEAGYVAERSGEARQAWRGMVQHGLARQGKAGIV